MILPAFGVVLALQAVSAADEALIKVAKGVEVAAWVGAAVLLEVSLRASRWG